MSTAMMEQWIETGEAMYRLNFKKTEDQFDDLWELKTSIRENLRDWLLASNESSRISELVANACSELLENCIKYAQNNSIVEICIQILPAAIQIDTTNVADAENLTILRTLLDLLHACPEPKQLFIERLCYPLEGKSQIGLIQIVMETNGTLTFIPEAHSDMAHLSLQIKTAQNNAAPTT